MHHPYNTRHTSSGIFRPSWVGYGTGCVQSAFPVGGSVQARGFVSPRQQGVDRLHHFIAKICDAFYCIQTSTCRNVERYGSISFAEMQQIARYVANHSPMYDFGFWVDGLNEYESDNFYEAFNKRYACMNYRGFRVVAYEDRISVEGVGRYGTGDTMKVCIQYQKKGKGKCFSANVDYFCGAEDGATAFLMGKVRRLGDDSLIQQLPDDVLRLIL
jgi:hypothetical protein